MPFKPTLDAQKIYLKEFEGTKPGYDALQVDSFLDIVVRDYEGFQSYVNETELKIKELNGKIKLLNDEIARLSVENVALNKKLDGIPEDGSVTMNNLELIKKLRAYEKQLINLGVKPDMIE